MTASTRSITAGDVVRLSVVALFFLAGATAGDIGGCNESAQDLDAQKFFSAKQNLDCERCLDCQILTAACDAACGASLGLDFPTGCYPLVHDGVVCLDALRIASCDAYQGFMADEGSTVPTECNFCPPRDDVAAGSAQ